MPRFDIPKLIYAVVHVLLSVLALGCGTLVFLGLMAAGAAEALGPGNGPRSESDSSDGGGSIILMMMVIGPVWGAVLGLRRKRLGPIAVVPAVLCVVALAVPTYVVREEPAFFYSLVGTTGVYVLTMVYVLLYTLIGPRDGSAARRDYPVVPYPEND